MKNFIFSLFASSLLFLVIGTSASADTSCQPIYGGGQTCVQVGNVFINKTVLKPGSSDFVDNLGINDPKYSPASNVTFHITVTNNGGDTVSKVTVKDVLPQFVSFVSGPGSFDSNTKVLTFDVGNLAAGESRTFTIAAKVADADKLPSNQGITCVVNQAMSTADNNQQSSDNSQFCIGKPVLGEPTKGGLKVFPSQPITKTPATGPEMLGLLGLIPSAITGFFLRKKTSS